ncbi:MAG: hypothetical protein ACP5T2_04395 [Thermoprotei archaeon]
MEIYLHPSCFSSYKLLKKLKSDGFLSEITLVDTSKDAPGSLQKGVISVPFIFENDEPVLVDPVSAEEVEALISGNRSQSAMTIGQSIESFLNSVMASGLAVASSLIRQDFLHLVRGNFFIAASKTNVYPHEFSLIELQQALTNEGSSYFQRKKALYARALVYNLVRHAFWAGKAPRFSDFELKELILMQASVGRVGMPYPPQVSLELVKEVQQILAEKGEEYYRRIVTEQETIGQDKEYLELIGIRSSPTLL